MHLADGGRGSPILDRFLNVAHSWAGASAFEIGHASRIQRARLLGLAMPRIKRAGSGGRGEGPGRRSQGEGLARNQNYYRHDTALRMRVARLVSCHCHRNTP